MKREGTYIKLERAVGFIRGTLKSNGPGLTAEELIVNVKLHKSRAGAIARLCDLMPDVERVGHTTPPRWRLKERVPKGGRIN